MIHSTQYRIYEYLVNVIPVNRKNVQKRLWKTITKKCLRKP
jgi:hypothetical protein